MRLKNGRMTREQDVAASHFAEAKKLLQEALSILKKYDARLYNAIFHCAFSAFLLFDFGKGMCLFPSRKSTPKQPSSQEIKDDLFARCHRKLDWISSLATLKSGHRISL